MDTKIVHYVAEYCRQPRSIEVISGPEGHAVPWPHLVIEGPFTDIEIARQRKDALQSKDLDISQWIEEDEIDQWIEESEMSDKRCKNCRVQIYEDEVCEACLTDFEMRADRLSDSFEVALHELHNGKLLRFESPGMLAEVLWDAEEHFFIAEYFLPDGRFRYWEAAPQWYELQKMIQSYIPDVRRVDSYLLTPKRWKEYEKRNIECR